MAFNTTCTVANDRIDPSSYFFSSDCGQGSFCAGGNTTQGATTTAVGTTCQLSRCQTDYFSLPSSPNAILPICPQNEFCPDNGSACLPKVAIGQACESGRDDECQNLPLGYFGKAICLNSVCVAQNGTQGATCQSQSSMFSVVADNSTVNETVIRSDCMTPAFYCSASTSLCIPSVVNGQSCAANYECQSGFCGSQGACQRPIGLTDTVPDWAFVVATFVFAGILLATVSGLVISRARDKRARTERRMAAITQQDAYRQALTELDCIVRRVTRSEAMNSTISKSGCSASTMLPSYTLPITCSPTRRSWSSPGQATSSGWMTVSHSEESRPSVRMVSKAAI